MDAIVERSLETSNFSDVLGHADRIEEFKVGIQKKVFSGPYLFAGPKGVGKFTIARILSKLIICSGLRDDFCRCETCSQFPNIPDYKEIVLPPDRSSIGVEDLESVREFLSLYPFQGEKRVLLMDDADRLTLPAANDLLKVTEELSGHNVMIFVTSKPNKILPMLKSRLFPVYFKSLETEDILTLLKRRGLNAGKLREIGGIAPYLSQSLLTDADKYLEQQTEVFQFVKTFGKKKEEDILKKIDDLSSSEQLIHFTEMLVVVLTDFLKLHYDSLDLVSSASRIEVYEEIYKTWSTDLLFYTIESLRAILVEQEKTIHANIKHRLKAAISRTYIKVQLWK